MINVYPPFSSFFFFFSLTQTTILTRVLIRLVHKSVQNLVTHKLKVLVVDVALAVVEGDEVVIVVDRHILRATLHDNQLLPHVHHRRNTILRVVDVRVELVKVGDNTDYDIAMTTDVAREAENVKLRRQGVLHCCVCLRLLNQKI